MEDPNGHEQDDNKVITGLVSQIHDQSKKDDRAHLDLEIDYAQLIGSRALILLLGGSKFARGVWTWKTRGLEPRFSLDSDCEQLLDKLPEGVKDQYKKYDPEKECFIVFTEPIEVAIQGQDKKKVRTTSRYFLVRKKNAAVNFLPVPLGGK